MRRTTLEGDGPTTLQQTESLFAEKHEPFFNSIGQNQ
jgi:hypothetical protein